MSRLNRIRPEGVVYASFLATLVITVTGLPYLRYAVYILPFWALIIWLVSGSHRMNLNKENRAFLFLMVLSIASIFPWDLNTLKKIYFISVFVAVFTLFDFSRINIDFRKLSIFLIALGVINGLMKHAGYGIQDYSIIESRSSFESTFAFPLGLVSLYFIVRKKFFWGLITALFLILFLKRIVIFALIVCVLIWMLPNVLRKWLLNPWVAIFLGLLVVWLSILFAQGHFDSYIFEYFGRSPNDLSKGRQVLWASALKAVDFDLWSFLFWGVGIGKIVTDLQISLNAERILLHNDLLALALEIGIIPFVLFTHLMTNLPNFLGRLFSLFLLILFATDNVLIYQHVMFVYLLIQSQLRREFNHNFVSLNNINHTNEN